MAKSEPNLNVNTINRISVGTIIKGEIVSSSDIRIDGTFDDIGNPLISDVERKRFTAGVTLGYYKKIRAELRLNFEKYFYNDGVAIGVSDHDKAVAELMINFSYQPLTFVMF